MSEFDTEKAARKYCDETGSMYFEYTDASNELIDAFKAGAKFTQEKLQAENADLKEKLNSFAVFGSDDCPYCDELVPNRITLFTRKIECDVTHKKQTNEGG